MGLLSINFLAYLIWLLYIWYKDREVTVYFLLLFFFTFLAFMGAFTVSTGIYQNTFGNVGLDSLKVEPYVYCFITYVILLWPFRLLKIDFSDIDFLFSEIMEKIVKVWSINYIIYSLIKISQAQKTLAIGLGTAYAERHDTTAVQAVYDNIFIEKFVGYGYFLLNASLPIIMCYAFIGTYLGRVSNLKAFFLIAIGFLPQFADSLAMGSRGSLFMNVLCVAFFIILFRDFTSNGLLKIISTAFISIIGITLFYSWMITSERFSDGSDGIDGIFRYFGEAFPNLGTQYWDKVLNHPMGARFFPNLFGLNVGGYETAEFWGGFTGVSLINFKTYFGDLYIEFGIIGAYLFSIICSTLMYFVMKNTSLGILKLPIVFFYYQLCVYAFSGMTKTGANATFGLLIIFLFILMIKFFKQTNPSS